MQQSRLTPDVFDHSICRGLVGDFVLEDLGFIFVPSSLRRSPNPPQICAVGADGGHCREWRRALQQGQPEIETRTSRPSVGRPDLSAINPVLDPSRQGALLKSGASLFQCGLALGAAGGALDQPARHAGSGILERLEIGFNDLNSGLAGLL